MRRSLPRWNPPDEEVSSEVEPTRRACSDDGDTTDSESDDDNDGSDDDGNDESDNNDRGDDGIVFN
jgi:hypothetical protein